MRRLSDDIKRRIVEHLACHNSHAEVANLILKEFGINLTPRHIRAYDPLSFQFAGSPRWLDFYWTVRSRYAEEIGQIAITHKVVRLQRLDALYHRAVELGADRQAAMLLEQAAKEVGNWFAR